MTLIKIQKFATKAELKAEQDKTVKLETQNLNYFLGKNFLVMMVLKMFFYQPTFSMVQLQENKGTDYILNWKSKAVYGFTLSLQYTHFLHSAFFWL